MGWLVILALVVLLGVYGWRLLFIFIRGVCWLFGIFIVFFLVLAILLNLIS